MKGSILGVSVAAIACAGSSLYLWRQLDIERARTQEVTELTRRLNARISELEAAKSQLVEQSLAAQDVAEGVPPKPDAAGAPPQDAVEIRSSESDPRAVAARPERSPAMQRVMRLQLRANTKRLYQDFADQVGLSQDEANAFFDLLTEQQMSNFGRIRDMSPDEARAFAQENRRQQQAKLNDFLGADKVEELSRYQESMPARSEVDMLSRQLEGADVALNDDQRKRLIAALTEERTRVPAPEYAQYGDREAYASAMNDWQADYDHRSAARARTILDTQQQSAYSEFQQWQSEMRQNFSRFPPGGGARRLRQGAPVAPASAQ